MNLLMLCAGFATRLRPLTEHTPKPLLLVAGRTILDRILDQFAETRAIDSIILITNHANHDRFMEWRAGRQKDNPQHEIIIFDDGATCNESRLGAVQDLALAVNRGNLEAPLLVAAGDNLFDFDFSRLLEDHARNPRSLVLAYREKERARLRRSGVASLDGDGKILHLVEKPEDPQGNWVCPPVYLFEADALAELPAFLAAAEDTDAPGHFISWLATAGLVWAHRMDGERYDVGTLESYRRADTWLAARRGRQ